MTSRLLEIENLNVRLAAGKAARPILDGVSLHVERGETVGLVGESGSGKSVTCRSVLGLLPEETEAAGSVRVDGEDVLTMSSTRLRDLRRRDVSMIFQDPRASINPLRRIGDYVTEGMRAGGVSRKDALKRATELLESVGIREPRAALRRYPHEFSGGMLQRVMIAGALAGEPRLLLADEPTTALDVTTQAEVISILTGLQAERAMGMLFVTHDLELAAAICDRICVMYAGRIVEVQSTAGLFDRPRHPYTMGLLAATRGWTWTGHRAAYRGGRCRSPRLRAGARSRPDALMRAPDAPSKRRSSGKSTVSRWPACARRN